MFTLPSADVIDGLLSFTFNPPTPQQHHRRTAAAGTSPGQRTVPSYSPLFATETLASAVIDSMSTYLMGYYIALGFGGISVIQAALLVSDRESGAKSHALLAGLLPVSYWLANLVFDLVLFLAPWVGTLVIAVVFGTDGVRNSASMAGVAVLVAVYGASSSLLSYCLSFVFTTTGGVMRYLSMVLTVVTTVLVFASAVVESPVMQTVASSQAVVWFTWAASCFPNYALARGNGRLLLLDVTSTPYHWGRQHLLGQA